MPTRDKWTGDVGRKCSTMKEPPIVGSSLKCLKEIVGCDFSSTDFSGPALSRNILHKVVKNEP